MRERNRKIHQLLGMLPTGRIKVHKINDTGDKKRKVYPHSFELANLKQCSSRGKKKTHRNVQRVAL